MASLLKSFASPRKAKAPAPPARPQASELALTRDTFAPQQADIPDEMIWESIPREYFEEECDPQLYTLEHLPDQVTVQALEREQAHQTRALDIIDSRLSGVIMDNYKAFVQGMSRVEEFGADLQTTNFLLHAGRQHLEKARAGLTGGGIEIVAKARKLRMLEKMYDDINGIKNIRVKEAAMYKALDSGDFPLAIELCADCQNDVTKYQRYHTVSELGTKYTEAMESIGDRLDAALKESALKFNPKTYESALVGYKLRGKPHMVLEVVLTHLSDLVDIVSHECVEASVLTAAKADPNARADRLKSKQFKELCGMIKDDADYIQFLRSLMAVLCNLMLNMYTMIQWHDQPLASGESNHYFQDTGARLKRARKSLWDDVQRKLSATLGAKSLASLKFEDFLTVLNLINSVINIGDAFSEVQAPTLRTSMKQVAVAYFKAAHKARMENLKTMLENESWQICPVQPDFGIKSMLEFDFSKNVAVATTAADAAPGEHAPLPPLPAQASAEAGVADGPLHLAPFDEALKHGGFSFADGDAGKGRHGGGGGGGLDSDGDDDVADDLKRDFVDEDGGADKPAQPKVQRSATDDESINATVRARRRAAHQPADQPSSKSPILAATTINVLRLIGRYISLSQLLSPIAYDVLVGMTQLVEFYVTGRGTAGGVQTYTTFKFFTADTAPKGVDLLAPSDPLLPSRLRMTLMRLRARYDERPADAVSLQDAAADNLMESRYLVPPLSASVEVRNPSILYALACRVTASESLLFVDSVLHAVRDRVEPLVPAARKDFLQQFYSQTVDVLGDLRRYMYRCISRRLVNFEPVIQQIEKVNWDMKELGSETSQYVDLLMKEFQQYKSRFQSDKRLQDLPAEVPDMLWRSIITNAIESMVEGYCRAKKVSSEGRAQMQLDFKTFQSSLEKLTGIRPLPHVMFMDTFLKAYYLAEEDAERWIREHFKEYSAKQLVSIISTGVGVRMSKKARQSALQLIEDLEKQRR